VDANELLDLISCLYFFLTKLFVDSSTFAIKVCMWDFCKIS